jgi:hypothetical protein
VAHQANYSGGHSVACEEGEVPVSGGYFIDPSWTYGVVVTSSTPTVFSGSGLKGWGINVANSSAVPVTVTVHAICVQAGN